MLVWFAESQEPRKSDPSVRKEKGPAVTGPSFNRPEAIGVITNNVQAAFVDHVNNLRTFHSQEI